MPLSSLMTFLTRVSVALGGLGALAHDSLALNGKSWISRGRRRLVLGLPWLNVLAMTLPSMFAVGTQVRFACGA